jgi:glycine/D-amino acid oxidase-like deaminating enzyme
VSQSFESFVRELASSTLLDGRATKPKIVVCGAGVIGCSIAYYFSLRNTSVMLVDRSGRVVPAASGKAGGFLALDWKDQASVGQLSRLSFR